MRRYGCPASIGTGVRLASEYPLYRKTETSGERQGEKYRDNIALYQSALDPLRGCKNQRYYIECPDGSLVIPPGSNFPKKKYDSENIPPSSADDKVWRWSFKTYKDKKDILVFKSTKTSPLLDENGDKAKWNIYTKSYLSDRSEAGTTPRDIWLDFINRKGADRLKRMNISYPYSKPVELIEYIGSIIRSKNNDIFLDYFAGSGTTAHAVINLNSEDNGQRKYILVEMGDYFDTVLKPRIIKVLYSKGWKDGKPKPDNNNSLNGTSHCFKYLRLESYEDTLNNLNLNKPTEKQGEILKAHTGLREDYMLGYALDVETSDSPSLLNIEQFEDPFNYKLNIGSGSVGATKPVTVDLVETFNYLIGLTVKHIDTLRGFKVVTGMNPQDESVLVIWRNVKTLDNAALEVFMNKQGYNPKDTEYDHIYVNGDHTLEDPHSKVKMTEVEFKRLMFDVQDV